MANRRDMQLDLAAACSKQYLRYLKRLRHLLGVRLTAEGVFKALWLSIIYYLVLLTTGMGWLGVINYVWLKRHERFPVYADTVCAMLQSIISVIKMLILKSNEHKLTELLKTLETYHVLRSLHIFDLDIGNKQQLMQNIANILAASGRNVQRQLKFFSLTTCLICCWYFFSCIGNNIKRYLAAPDQCFELVLPTSASFEFLFQSYANAPPAYAWQFICTGMVVYVAGVGAIAFDGIFIACTVHCKAMFEVLCELLASTEDAFVPAHLRAPYLRHCIDFQQRIVSIFEHINEAFYFISLSQFMLSLLILCMVLFQASIGLEGNLALFVKMLLYLSAAGFEIFLFCYNGQRLTNQTTLLPYAWYSTAWCNESKQFQYYVQMMILRSNKQLIFSVGGFATMSMETLLLFMQTCGSYFLLLRKVNAN